MLNRLIGALLLVCSILGTMLALVLPGIGIVHAATTAHCMTAHWTGRKWVCVKDPKHLMVSPSSVQEEDPIPVSFTVTGSRLIQRGFYEIITDFGAACDVVQVLGPVFHLDSTNHFVLSTPPITLIDNTVAPIVRNTEFVHTDLHGFVNFVVTVDACLDGVYHITLVDSSDGARRFGTHVTIKTP